MEPPKTEPDYLLRMFSSPQRFFSVLGAYFGLHVVIRMLLDGAANLDEAEQLFLAQTLKLGYGPQPPLYTWMQAGVFALAGTNLFALALLKNALLFCTYTLAYLIGRRLTGLHFAGVLAAISLLFIPQIAWESQRDLTHSVMASTLSLAALYAFLRMHAESSKDWRWHVVLGIVLGAGVLAKYNFIIWAAALLVAGMTLREYRSTLATWKTAAVLALGGIIAAPHFVWALANRDQALASSGKLALDQAGGWAITRLTGLGNMLFAAGSFILPLIAVFGALLWLRSGRTKLVELEPEARLIVRSLVAMMVLLCLAILLFGATGFKDRWFQPLLISPCVVLSAYIASALHERRLFIQKLSLAVMIVVAMLIPGKVLSGGLTKRGERLNIPYQLLLTAIENHVQPETVILADTQLIAGNLRLIFPRNRVEIIGTKPPEARNWLMVWDAEKRMKPPAPAMAWLELDQREPFSFEFPWRFQATKTFHVRVLKSD